MSHCSGLSDGSLPQWTGNSQSSVLVKLPSILTMILPKRLKAILEHTQDERPDERCNCACTWWRVESRRDPVNRWWPTASLTSSMYPCSLTSPSFIHYFSQKFGISVFCLRICSATDSLQSSFPSIAAFRRPDLRRGGKFFKIKASFELRTEWTYPRVWA